jgi:hypothetical protein
MTAGFGHFAEWKKVDEEKEPGLISFCGMILEAGPVALPIPRRRLPLALTGPYGQRREPADYE